MIRTFLLLAVISIPPPANANDASEVTQRIEKVETALAVVRDYNDDFLAVLIWGLGALVAMTVVLIGLNWFQSNRTLRREFDALKSELQNSLLTSSSEAAAKMDAAIGELKKVVDEKASAAAELKVAQIRGRINGLQSQVNELKFLGLKAQVEHWLEVSVPQNAVSTSKDLIQCAIATGQQWRISAALDMLTMSLDKLARNAERLEVQDLTELVEVIETIPDGQKLAKSALMARLAKLHS